MIDRNTSEIKPVFGQTGQEPIYFAPQSRQTSAPTEADKAIIAAASAHKQVLYTDPAHPDVLPILWDSIPASLRALPQWVGWQLVWRDSSWAKVPIKSKVDFARGWRNAKPNDPATWSAFERVRSMWNPKLKTEHSVSRGVVTLPDPAGPGFMFKAGGGILGVDLDKCRHPVTGELTTFAQKSMRDSPGAWEVSPSRTGIKGTFFGQLPESWNGKGRNQTLPDGQEIEVYDRGRYFAFTGHQLPGATPDLTTCGEQFAKLLEECFPATAAGDTSGTGGAFAPGGRCLPPADRTVRIDISTVSRDERIRRARSYLYTVEGAVEKQGGDKRTYRVACLLILGFALDINDAYDLICEWNLTCKPFWKESAIWRKLVCADRLPGPRGGKLEWERARGYENLTPTEVVELCNEPPAPPITEDCPHTAASDLRELLQPHYCTHGPWQDAYKPKAGVAGAVLLGCHDPNCTACTSQLVARVIKTDLDWILDQTDANRPGGAMHIDAMVIPLAQKAAAIRAAQKVNAPFRWIDTTAPVDVQALLDAPPEAISSFVHSEAERQCTKDDVPSKRPVYTLFLTLRPADAKPISGRKYKSYSRPTANVIRAFGEALSTIPPSRANKRRSFSARSGQNRKPDITKPKKPDKPDRKWGVDIVTEPGDLQFGARAVIRGPEIRDITDALGWTTEFVTGSDQVQGKKVGYRGPSPAHTLVLRLLVTAAGYQRQEGSPWNPDAEQIHDLVRRWNKILPNGFGGPAVEQFLRARLWHPPATADLEFCMDFFAADSCDRADVVPSTIRTKRPATPVTVDDFSTL